MIIEKSSYYLSRQVLVIDLKVLEIDSEDWHIKALDPFGIVVVDDELQEERRVLDVSNLLNHTFAALVQVGADLLDKLWQIDFGLFFGQKLALNLKRLQVGRQLLDHSLIAAAVLALVEYEANVEDVLISFVLFVEYVDRVATNTVFSNGSIEQQI